MAEPQLSSEAVTLGPAEFGLRDSRIGGKLRLQRERLGISGRELARRIGVSPSLISAIELDRVMPSVQTLWALASALGVTMGDIFHGPTTDGPASAVRMRPEPVETPETRAVANLGSGVRWERLTQCRDPHIEFLYVVYDVGGASCDDDTLMTHGGKEYGYVMSGRLGVRIGFDEYELSPGHSVSYDASSPHRLWNVGTQPVHAIWVVFGRQPWTRFALDRGLSELDAPR
jgi:transcriptional regulator with XRE-family HTH domain